jgi:transcriptional regulator with XRE-family HTH domain
VPAAGPYLPEAFLKARMTQEILGDILGLSVVHINRTLQLMRQGKIKLASGLLTLLDIPELLAVSEYQLMPSPRRSLEPVANP